MVLPITNPKYTWYMKNIQLCFALLLMTIPLFAQNPAAQYEHQLFRGTRIVNGHSVETLHEGEMEFIIGHRFGRLNDGAYELFGLDQSTIRLGLDYGIRDWLTIGGGRSSLGKEFDAFSKIRLLQQGALGFGGFPFSATFFTSVAYNTTRNSDPERPLSAQNRLAYTYQLYLARKLNDHLSVQLMPSVVHYNLVESSNEKNDKLAIGVAAKYQVSKNIAITSEYYYSLPGYLPSSKTNPLSIGFDLNTGSHVFQLHFTNSTALIEKQFIGETTGNWANGDIHFGFNMVRTFKLKGRRY